MEAAKPPHQRHPGGPYVYFAHNDMANTANACGGQPPPSYCDCRPGGPGPGCLLRTRDFDFRGHCERQPLPHLPEEAEACGIEVRGRAWKRARQGSRARLGWVGVR